MRKPKLISGESGLQPDPSRIGHVAEASFVRLPDPNSCFAVRAGRLTALAEGNPLDAYLRFLAGLADLQQQAVAAGPVPHDPEPGALAARREHGMPLLSRDLLAADPAFAATLDWLIGHSVPGATEQAEAARHRLLGHAPPERLELATAAFDASYGAEELGEGLYAAAAVQVYMTRQAARLDPDTVRPLEEVGVCPVCGSAPVASVVVGWSRAEKARYCACSLCGTYWNFVRIRCTSCGTTEGISYYTLDGGAPAVAVESCSKCRSYIKHLHQHEDALVEAFADDVASYGLDVLIQEEGFRRGGINPLFITA